MAKDNIIFYKFHGAGNDFVLVDNRNRRFFPEAEIEQLCRRRTSVGADGFILLEDDPEGSDFRMRYFNADGGEASLCGNGSRCVVAFARYLGIIGNDCRFRAFDGLHTATIEDQSEFHWWVSVRLHDVSEIISHEDGLFLDTGSPHFVIFPEEEVDILDFGRKFRYDARFDNGTNVDFIRIREDDIYVRTYERGVEDETLSCGTGVTAAAIAFARKMGLREGKHHIPVETPGGKLAVSFEISNGRFTGVTLSGPAVCVFRGEIKAENF